MTAKLSWLVCLALSAAIHLAVAVQLAQAPETGDRGGGGNRGASVSLALARPAALEALVARWERPPVAQTEPPVTAPPDTAPSPPVAAMTPDRAPRMPAPAAPSVISPPVPPRDMAPPAPVRQALRRSPRPPPRADRAVRPAPSAASSAAAVASGQGGAVVAGRGRADGGTETALKRTWAGQIRSAIARHHAVPAAARRQGIGGRVLLRVTVGVDGALGSVTLRRGSRSALLDDAALATVRRAAPFPRAPRGVAGPATLDVPLNFVLR